MQEEEINRRRMTLNARTSLLLLLLILVLGKLSNSGGTRTGIERCNAASNKEVAVLEKISTAARETLLGGRKMALNNRMKMEKKAEKYGASEANLKTSEGAKMVATKYDNKDGEAGFVAFNADYRGPRHHPPKNN